MRKSSVPPTESDVTPCRGQRCGRPFLPAGQEASVGRLARAAVEMTLVRRHHDACRVERRFVIEPQQAPGCRPRRRVRLERVDQGADVALGQHGVRIEAQVVLARRTANQRVVSGRETDVRVRAGVLVGARQAREERARLWRRLVVPDVQGHRRMVLGTNRRDAPRQQRVGMPGDDADGDGRKHGRRAQATGYLTQVARSAAAWQPI